MLLDGREAILASLQRGEFVGLTGAGGGSTRRLIGGRRRGRIAAHQRSRKMFDEF
jgi:hypothetical protein